MIYKNNFQTPSLTRTTGLNSLSISAQKRPPSNTLSIRNKPNLEIIQDLSSPPSSAELRKNRFLSFLPSLGMSAHARSQSAYPSMIEPTDPTPLEVDDILAAVAGHTSHPSPLISSLFAGAGIVAGLTTVLGLHTAIMARKSLCFIKFQIKSLTMRAAEDRQELQKLDSAKLLDRVQNTKVLLDERNEALKAQKQRFITSLLMSFGTGTQFLGILSSGALLGTYTGTLVLSPILLGIGLLSISLFAAWSSLKKIQEFKHLSHKKYDYSQLNHSTTEILKKSLIQKKIITCMGFCADLLLSGGTLIAGISALGLITTPAALGVIAVICVSAGVSGLVAHSAAERGILYFKHSIGIKKRFIGNISNIQNTIQYLKQSQNEILKLSKDQSTQSLLQYLNSNRSKECDQKAEAFTATQAMFDHLHKNKLLNKTLDRLVKKLDKRTLSLISEKTHNGLRFSLNCSKLSSSQLEKIYQVGITIIINDLYSLRSHQIKELSDHLSRRLEYDSHTTETNQHSVQSKQFEAI